jgi:hypothetical protein
MTERDYFTWEQDLTSDRSELHGLHDELIAIVDRVGDDQWTAHDAAGVLIAACHKEREAQRAAEKLIGA